MNLKCPSCGEEYLHQQEVRAHWRDEDQDAECHTSAHHKTGVEKVPSKLCVGRRDWIEIDFECEFCGPTQTLMIQQHKGNTIVEWLK